MHLFTSTLTLLAVLGQILCHPLTNALAEDVNYRLPTDVLPINYNVTLRPYLLASDGDKRFTFDGEAYVQLRPTVKDIKTIVIHSKNLTISSLKLYDIATPNVTINNDHKLDTKTDKLTIGLKEPLVLGKNYTLHFLYTGVMEDDMHGFYKSKYVDDRNNTKWIGSTQFQTMHARRVFPCFDEPQFKATFDITIIRHNSFKAVSNTRLIQTTPFAPPSSEYWRDTFNTTPFMSTYLVAFLVSDFNERGNGNFSVVARPEYYSHTSYAFEVGQKLLSEFDKYTGLPYYTLGVDKMHLAAIPDFSAGAMENWGLLTFRERALLYDPTSTTLSAKQSIAEVIGHEQAHMWFGDLVTCKLWGYAWLNEGFARYFQYFMTAEVHPEWELDKQFVVNQVQAVFVKDATNDTNPMSDPQAASPDDLTRMFNTITYNKGASIIRMIKHTIGEANFKKSIQTYLKARSHNNSIPTDIFAHWKANWPKEHDKYADGVLNSFTTQVGYPLIHFEVNSDKKGMKIHQKRYVSNPAEENNRTLLYTVPITYTTNNEGDFNTTSPKIYLEAKTDKVSVNFQKEITWIIGNIQEVGYYRVNYSADAWHGIHHALKSAHWGGIPEINRAQYVDDLYALSRSGDIPYNFALGLLDYLETEVNYLPWTAAFNGLNYLAIRLGVDNQSFKSYVTRITSKVYNLSGFEERQNDTALEIYTRSKVLSWNCKYGQQSCIKKALKIFRNLNTTSVPLNIRSAIYCTALRDGTEADFESLYDKLKTESSPTERTLIINQLGCVKDRKLVERYFKIILSGAIRRQDKSSALTSLYSENPENVSPVFELILASHKELVKSLGSHTSAASIISGIASRLTTAEQEQKLDKFNKDNGAEFGTSRKTLDDAAKSVKLNLAWDASNLPTVKGYFTNYQRGGAGRRSFSLMTAILVAMMSFLLL